jgi:hypothetical protein
MHQDLEETRTAVNKLMTSISSLRQNKIVSDKASYVDAVNNMDTLKQSLEKYQKDPPSPIKIFSSKGK